MQVIASGTISDCRLMSLLPRAYFMRLTSYILLQSKQFNVLNIIVN